MININKIMICLILFINIVVNAGCSNVTKELLQESVVIDSINFEDPPIKGTPYTTVKYKVTNKTLDTYRQIYLRLTYYNKGDETVGYRDLFINDLGPLETKTYEAVARVEVKLYDTIEYIVVF